MATIVFNRLNSNHTMFKNREVPRVGDQVFLDEKLYEVSLVRHYMEGAKLPFTDTPIFEPFVFVTLIKI